MTASLPIDTALVFDSVENIYGQFKKILAQCALNGHKTINIILKKNIKCDGSGLSLLVECKKQCDKHGILLYIDGVGQDLKQLMEFYGIVNWFLYIK